MGLENRGRVVGLVNSGTPKQKIRVIFVFFSFYNFYSFFMHKLVYAQKISLILMHKASMFNRHHQTF